MRTDSRRRFPTWVMVAVAAVFVWAWDAGMRAQAPPPMHHYFGPTPNFANSPLPDSTGTGGIRKFVDGLPGLGPTGANNIGQYIPVAVPDPTTYPGSDYYEIAVVQYREKMHSDLPPTTLRGYVQLSTEVVRGDAWPLVNPNGSPVNLPDGTQARAVDRPHYLGPMILATRDRPVRVLFRNLLPTGQGGDLFLPVDTTIPGAGRGPANFANLELTPRTPPCGAVPKPLDCYTENRATLRLHGGLTPWISDGGPHQWITPATPAGEQPPTYPRGVSVYNVPDMPDPGPGAMTFFYSNQQSARLLFYHDGSVGITRLNVYAGQVAPYRISDATEQGLIGQGIIPGDQIPLIIQDKTFVPPPTQLTAQDPSWDPSRWGGQGSLWVPHVYVVAQNPYDISGMNPFGRWAYGPWFWPPAASILYPPIDNPYYDPACDPDLGPCEPYQTPGVPLVSAGGDDFHDTPVINGTAYPTTNVDPKAYRLRIVNASNDRFWNLQLYTATSPPDCPGCASDTEVKMVPALPIDQWGTPPPGFPDSWPLDGREGGVPDPATKGPDWIQIGNDGGFLPAPVVIPAQPVTWNLDPQTFNFGNVQGHSLLLGPSERADVVVDFSQFAGKTLILYNDAPAPFPALDPRYDYHTGGPNLTASGGAPATLPGRGPNTRTIMQIRVSSGSAAPAFNVGRVRDAFLHGPNASGVFESSQNPIVVGQANVTLAPAGQPRIYDSVSGTTFPKTWPEWGISRIQDFSLSFRSAPSAAGPFTLTMQPKALHDEMGAAYDTYGRTSPRLGVEVPFTTSLNTQFVLYPYANPPTEVFTGISLPPGVAVAPMTSQDEGTQIWKITHNGVETHAIYFGPFGAQLVNRVGWDGAIRLPEANELGWKDTIRISPLEDTIVAIRPILPKLPFGVPNSVRSLNPALPNGRYEGFVQVDVNGQNISPPITNVEFDFGWEYHWGGTAFSHHDSDLKRPIKVVVTTAPPPAPLLTTSGLPGTPVNLTWTDGTSVTSDPATWGDSRAEVGFRIERAIGSGTLSGIGFALANATAFQDGSTVSSSSYRYRVVAYNAAGESPSNVVTLLSTVPPAGPTGLLASLPAGGGVGLTWSDNSTEETGFRVERALVAGGIPGLFATVGSLAANTGSFIDLTVAPATTYAYRVFAFNGVGDSIASNTATITTPAAPLAAPTNLSASLQSGPRVRVTFTDNALTETGFVLERSRNGGGFAILANLGPLSTTGTVTYTDSAVALNNTYAYRVKAVSGGASSGYSNTSPAIDVRLPAAPSNLTATAVAKSDKAVVTLKWTDNATNEDRFEIERAANGTFSSGSQLIKVSADAVTRLDTVERGKSYYYRIRTVNVLGRSAWVNAVPFPIVTP